ncbi:hypothetical protein [Streptomyces sp. Inha503]|uniref:hypothetical protein n=1 Tax=Streptomyces sp. Inha503 TaxID=3383314 RepID=UPI0039A0F9DD
MTQDEIRAMFKPLGPIRDALADAEPRDKAEVYQQLGLKLIYEARKTARAGRGSARPAQVGDTLCVRGGT